MSPFRPAGHNTLVCEVISNSYRNPARGRISKNLNILSPTTCTQNDCYLNCLSWESMALAMPGLWVRFPWWTSTNKYEHLCTHYCKLLWIRVSAKWCKCKKCKLIQNRGWKLAHQDAGRGWCLSGCGCCLCFHRPTRVDKEHYTGLLQSSGHSGLVCMYWVSMHVL